MALISKRLRAHRKKYNRITEMEESVSQGKTLNKEQKEAIRSKPIVIALIEELEKLRLPPSPPPSAAGSEEISLPAKKNKKKKVVAYILFRAYIGRFCTIHDKDLNLLIIFFLFCRNVRR